MRLQFRLGHQFMARFVVGRYSNDKPALFKFGILLNKFLGIQYYLC